MWPAGKVLRHQATNVNELAAFLYRDGKIDAIVPSNVNSNKPFLKKKHAKNGGQTFEGGFTIALSFIHIYNSKLS